MPSPPSGATPPDASQPTLPDAPQPSSEAQGGNGYGVNAAGGASSSPSAPTDLSGFSGFGAGFNLEAIPTFEEAQASKAQEIAAQGLLPEAATAHQSSGPAPDPAKAKVQALALAQAQARAKAIAPAKGQSSNQSSSKSPLKPLAKPLGKPSNKTSDRPPAPARTHRQSKSSRAVQDLKPDPEAQKHIDAALRQPPPWQDGARKAQVLLGLAWGQAWDQVGQRIVNPLWRPLEGAVSGAIAQLGTQQQQQLRTLWAAGRPVLLTTLVVMGSLTLLRQIGTFEAVELRAYDFMIRQRPTPPPDDRLLIVGITELDIRRLNDWPLTDEVFATAFATIQAQGPRAIGLDIYRDFPQPPGKEALYEQFQQPNVIGIEKKPNLLDPVGVAPPPIAEAQIGFNDVILDPDTALRRGLLLMFGEAGEVQYSFPYRLASLYLAAEGIEAANIPGSDFGIALGKAHLEHLNSNSGGYQNIDSGGYQLLLNYRAAFAEQVAETVSLTDVLDGKLKPEQVKDRVVLIGSTAPSNKDYFFTPFTRARRGGLDMPGVVAHAQFVSQLIDAALGDRPMISFWPEWLELTLLAGCVGLGSLLTILLRHPLQLLAAHVGGVALLTTIHWLLFLQYTWVPIVLPLVGLIASSIATVAYNSYRIKQEQKLLAQRAEEQEQAILMLRMSSRQARPETSIQAPKPIQAQGLLNNRYLIKEVLASGGFGVTYVAQDQQRPGAPECVVKQLRPTLQDPQFLKVARRLFKTEAEILEIVGRHSRIPQLLAYFEDGPDFYLVEELVVGSPLGDRLPQDRRLSDKVVFKMLKELLPTLAFIHERHIIHRDIKPNNIIHRPADDALVLIDFGAVKQIQPNLSELEVDKTIAIGTQGYAAPEQLAGHPRINSDIYSLGVIAIRALTGVPPHMMEQNPNTGDLAWFQYARCNRGLAKVVHRMSRYHFAERYATADEALRDLLALL